MATAIKIPDLGTNVEQVRLVAWLKKEGDHINRGDVLCEVETDKAVSELESIAEGVLLKRVVPEDTELEQGTIIAYIGASGETLPTADQPSPDVSPIRASMSTAAVAVPSVLPSGSAQPALMIRNLAKKLGVDLTRVVGTGPAGRILREDVLKAAEKNFTDNGGRTCGEPISGRLGTASPSKKLSDTLTEGPQSGAKFSAHQAAIARRVMQSHREIPPINLTCQIDLSALTAYRYRIEEKERKLSFDAFFIFAAAGTMMELSHFRSRLQGETVIIAEEVNVGVAIGIGAELFTPVIRRANAKSIQEIDAEVRQAADRAKKHLLQPADMTGASMTISNLGMYPVRSFAAVIPPDQVAALAIGCAQDVPVARNGSVQIIPAAIVTLSVDHRLINGREAGQFLAQFKERIEKL